MESGRRLRKHGQTPRPSGCGRNCRCRRIERAWGSFQLLASSQLLQEQRMDPRVGGQFGMKGGHQVAALFYQYLFAPVASQHLGFGTRTADDGRADEYRFHVAGAGPPDEIAFRLDLRYTAVELPAITVTLYPDIHQCQALLHGM